MYGRMTCSALVTDGGVGRRISGKERHGLFPLPFECTVPATKTTTPALLVGRLPRARSSSA